MGSLRQKRLKVAWEVRAVCHQATVIVFVQPCLFLAWSTIFSPCAEALREPAILSSYHNCFSIVTHLWAQRSRGVSRELSQKTESNGESPSVSVSGNLSMWQAASPYRSLWHQVRSRTVCQAIVNHKDRFSLNIS